jgi:hypothetical protein
MSTKLEEARRRLQELVKKQVTLRAEPLNNFDELDDYTITHICQDLIDKKEYSTLAKYVRSSKRIHKICQPLLTKAKQSEYVYQVTSNNDVARSQLDVSHPHKNDHAIFVLVDDDHRLLDAIGIYMGTNAGKYWLAQSMYDSKNPTKYGWDGRFEPTGVNKGKYVGEVIQNYYAVLINRTDGQYQYDKLVEYLAKCRATVGPCYFYYELI